MKAVRLHAHGGPEILRFEDIPEPHAEPNRVLVRMHAAALNHLDLWVRNGLPGVEFLLPVTMGSDGAGIVLESGPGVTQFSVGERVVVQPGTFCGECNNCTAGRHNLCVQYGILGESEDGVQAELVSLKAENLAHLPDHLSYEEGASFGLVFLTAWQMLIKRAALQPGETVLILGGNSGVGAAGIQIAREHGATVIATASGAVKTRFALDMGAHHVVDHYQEDWFRQVLKLAGPKKVQVVFEHVGAATWEQSMRTLGHTGRLVFCGATTGPKVGINLRHAYSKQLSILGSTMGDLDSFQSVISAFDKQKYRPFVARVFPMSQVSAAHAYLESSSQCGKVVLRVNGD